ncbi:MAG: hypothetical protein Q9207_000556 [Kuettlingeria erythrocarpa]
MSEHSSLLRPTPRRHFDFTPSSSNPPTPAPEPQATLDQEPDNSGNGNGNGSGLKFSDRTRSILNLTSSTLFGIYAPSDSPRDGSSTPWASGLDMPGTSPKGFGDDKLPVTGAYDQPQMHRRPLQPHTTLRNYCVPLVLRTMLLFFFGVAYGSIVTHLHDNQRIAPVKVEGIHRYTWRYLAFWGAAGVFLGTLLPMIDGFWERTLGERAYLEAILAVPEDVGPQGESSEDDQGPSKGIESVLGADWNPAVRSIGAFVGIAFAIRKLPWQSTLQVSLTLAMVNPALWYLIDRSKPGFLLSAVVGVTGTALLLGINPNMVPAPPAPSPQAHGIPTPKTPYGEFSFGHGMLVSNESIAVSTWVASVLFCSSVCFGNIGRRLALDPNGRKGSFGIR